MFDGDENNYYIIALRACHFGSICYNVFIFMILIDYNNKSAIKKSCRQPV